MPVQMAILQPLIKFVTIAFSSNKEPRLDSVFRLAHRKFGELERSHKLFLSIAGKLENSLKNIQPDLDAATSKEAMAHEVKRIEEAIHEAARKRNTLREKRRELYEEAKVYVEDVSFDKTVLTTVPTDITNKLKFFMAEYCKYFERENEYHHSISNTLDAGATMLAKIKGLLSSNRQPEDFFRVYSSGDDERTKQEFAKDGGPGMSDFEAIRHIFAIYLLGFDGGSSDREHWARVSNAYYQLNGSLLEYGVVQTLPMKETHRLNQKR
jgi:hypothetical protein